MCKEQENTGLDTSSYWLTCQLGLLMRVYGLALLVSLCTRASSSFRRLTSCDSCAGVQREGKGRGIQIKTASATTQTDNHDGKQEKKTKARKRKKKEKGEKGERERGSEQRQGEMKERLIELGKQPQSIAGIAGMADGYRQP